MANIGKVYVGNMEYGRCPYGGGLAEWEEHGTIWTKVSGTWTSVQRAFVRVSGTWVPAAVYIKESGSWRRIT
jgi:hypothetical protein